MYRSSLVRDLASLQQTLDQFSSQFDPRMSTARSHGSDVTLPLAIDVYATNDYAVVVAAAPGMQPEDLELTVHENTVTLSGTIRSVADAEDAKEATWYVSELHSGSCQRSVTLPFPIDAEHATAHVAHGIVRVKLPKAASAKPRKIAVTTEGEQAVSAHSTPERE